MKITQGNVFASGLEVIAMPSQIKIAKVSGATYEEAQANAQLTADAFNVRQQINVDLPEILKQRNEMVQVLKEIKEWWDSDDIMNDHLPIEKVTELITKIERK